MSWSAAMVDGFTLAALIKRGSDPHAESAALQARISDAATAQVAQRISEANEDSSLLPDLVRRFRPQVVASRVRDASPRIRALVGTRLSAGERQAAAAWLSNLPRPRRGYRPPPGLADMLLGVRSRQERDLAAECELLEWKEEIESWPHE